MFTTIKVKQGADWGIKTEKKKEKEPSRYGDHIIYHPNYYTFEYKIGVQEYSRWQE